MVLVNTQENAAQAAPSPREALPDYVTSPNAVFADEGVQWRYGRAPDYTKTRKVWREGKKMNHTAGSLEEMVENLVKNWEVEASFKTKLDDWRTVDHAKYTFSVNGGPPQTGEHMLKVGTYNAVITPNEYYSPDYSDFASSHKTFKRMMPTFAWEVLEVYSGPPVVAFRWRHWGVMKNDYVGFNDKGDKVTAKAHGGPIDIEGVTIARVDDKLRLQAVDTWFDSLQMFRQIAPDGVVMKEAKQNDLGPEARFDEAVAQDVNLMPAEISKLHSDISASGIKSGGCPVMMNRE
ncbi:Pathogen-related protein [Colletotrichum chlorophyti]|uniref:Pathogen-related protein n=1 Tax=Colletotrichum chlorophyti TaxID=708187 RepID=A0A1Q8S839_9PEZI|nr:Pathogen-related protein [Colletotrichum chlorophyti]